MLEGLHPIIEKLVIKKELRDRIVELRAEGNLREESYQFLRKTLAIRVFGSLGLWLFFLIVMIIGGFPIPLLLGIFGVFLLIITLSLRGNDAGKPAYFYTIGAPEIARITGFHFNHHVHSFSIAYAIEKGGKTWIIKDGYQKSLLHSKGFDKHPDLERAEESFYRSLSKGHPILVLVIAHHLKAGMVYFPTHFDQFCLDKNKFEEIQKFIGKQKGLVNV